MTKQFLLEKWHFRCNVTNSNYFGVLHVVLNQPKGNVTITNHQYCVSVDIYECVQQQEWQAKGSTTGTNTSLKKIV